MKRPNDLTGEILAGVAFFGLVALLIAAPWLFFLIGGN